MARLSKLIADIASSTLERLADRGRSKSSRGRAQSSPKRTQDRPGSRDEAPSAGQFGKDATVEIDPRSVGSVRLTYAPETDGEPDPGEVVWTWVPYEENDGRGKDRPVLLVAAEQSGTFLGIQLTSKRHDDADFLAVGSGDWDIERRPSWVNLDRVFRIHPSGMRREGTALGRDEFQTVVNRLSDRYGWSSST